ncbi:hypothetical protein [Halarchaeum sp. P4]|uniref:hypothetical protein n=1 Tax=Halarchaeum sp. P4 TaxID=3421639 RepID=UPI003EC0C991
MVASAGRRTRRRLPIVLGVAAFTTGTALVGLDAGAVAATVTFFAAKTAESLAAATR